MLRLRGRQTTGMPHELHDFNFYTFSYVIDFYLDAIMIA